MIYLTPGVTASIWMSLREYATDGFIFKLTNDISGEIIQFTPVDLQPTNMWSRFDLLVGKTDNWILQTGRWNDLGYWKDTSLWIDSPDWLLQTGRWNDLGYWKDTSQWIDDPIEDIIQTISVVDLSPGMWAYDVIVNSTIVESGKILVEVDKVVTTINRPLKNIKVLRR